MGGYELIPVFGEREGQRLLTVLAIVAVFVFYFGVIWLKTIRRRQQQTKQGFFVQDNHVASALPEAGKEFAAAMNKSTRVASRLKNILVCGVCGIAGLIFGIMTVVDLFNTERVLSGQILWSLIPAMISAHFARAAYRDIRS